MVSAPLFEGVPFRRGMSVDKDYSRHLCRHHTRHEQDLMGDLVCVMEGNDEVSACMPADSTVGTSALSREDVFQSFTSCDSFSMETRDEDERHAFSEANERLEKDFADEARYTFHTARSGERTSAFGLQQPLKIDEPGARVESFRRCLGKQKIPGMNARLSSRIMADSSLDFMRESDEQDSLGPCDEVDFEEAPDVPHFPFEIMDHVEEQHIDRTLAVRGISELGIDALGVLRRHFRKFGEVELVIEPRLTLASGFAVVRVKDIDTIRNVMAFGESHSIGQRTVMVQRLDSLRTA
eukprot:TRINITY_DN9100_c0_g1_i2.p1 TRINITY_DN9100_c0_g1~~TRINITY_DN9100_c0_g1_i2.p1  ORF type:complete len:295 (-),score=36.57 TRINITY_DN9100_c0_g1_i2:358-1242(-)